MDRTQAEQSHHGIGDETVKCRCLMQSGMPVQYPDFLLWLVDDATGEQWLNFIDPKGIRQMNLHDPKLGLYKEVKVLEAKLADPKLTLNAFIVSGTAYADLLNVSVKKKELEDRNVLFMEDGGSVYLKKLFDRTVLVTPV